MPNIPSFCRLCSRHATVGDLPYNSTITLTTEVLPVTISFIAQKNCVSLLPFRDLFTYSHTMIRISCSSASSLLCKMLELSVLC